jgi:hypothetical protein
LNPLLLFEIGTVDYHCNIGVNVFRVISAYAQYQVGKQSRILAVIFTGAFLTGYQQGFWYFRALRAADLLSSLRPHHQ